MGGTGEDAGRLGPVASDPEAHAEVVGQADDEVELIRGDSGLRGGVGGRGGGVARDSARPRRLAVHLEPAPHGRKRRDELLGEGVGVGLAAAAPRPVEALVVGLAVAERQVGELVGEGEALQRDRPLKAVDEDEGTDGGGGRAVRGRADRLRGPSGTVDPGRRDQGAGAVRRVGVEAGVDDVHARSFDQGHEIGQRSLVADTELVAPEARQADRVAVHGVGQRGEWRRAREAGQVRFRVRAGEGLDLEGVAHDRGEQRRLEGARPRVAARHGIRCEPPGKASGARPVRVE